MKFVWLRLALCSLALLLMAPTASVTKTWGNEEILTAGDLNQNFTDNVNAINAIDDDKVSASADIDPTKLDAHQDTQGEAETHTDPSGIASATLAATLAAEIQQIRFQLRDIANQDNNNWYESLLNVGFSTGDVKLTIKNAADAGWVVMDDQTIGDAGNNCTERANADTEALFDLLWNRVVNVRTLTSTINSIDPNSDGAGLDVFTTAAAHGLGIGDRVRLQNISTTAQINNTTEIVISVPTTTTFDTTTDLTAVADGAGDLVLELIVSDAGVPVDKGADPNADFATANRCIFLPRTLGRALAGADVSGGGTAPGQAAQAIGSVGGEHSHTLTTAEMPAHTHDETLSTNTTGGTNPHQGTDALGSNMTTTSTGGGNAHNIRGPITYLSVMMKL